MSVASFLPPLSRQWHKIHEAKNPAELFRHFHNLCKFKTVAKTVKVAVGVIAAFKDASAADADGAKALTDSSALPSGSDDEVDNDREDSSDAIALDGDGGDDNGADDDTDAASAQSSAGDAVGGS